MTVTATPLAMVRSNQKPAPTVERVMVASDVLLSVFSSIRGCWIFSKKAHGGSEPIQLNAQHIERGGWRDNALPELLDAPGALVAAMGSEVCPAPSKLLECGCESGAVVHHTPIIREDDRDTVGRLGVVAGDAHSSGEVGGCKSMRAAIAPEAAQCAVWLLSPKSGRDELRAASKSNGFRHLCWSGKNAALAALCDDSAPSGAVDDVWGHGLVLFGGGRGSSVGAKGLVDVAVAEAVEVGGVRLKGCVVGGDLNLSCLDGGSDRGKSLSGQSDVADLGDAGSVAGDGLDAHVTLALAVDRGGDDNLKLAAGLADALAIEQVSGRDGDFEGGSGGGGPVDRLHLVWSVGLASVAQLRSIYTVFVYPQDKSTLFLCSSKSRIFSPLNVTEHTTPRNEA